MIGLTETAEVVLDGADHALVRRDLRTVTDALTRAKLEILSGCQKSASVTRRTPPGVLESG